MGITIPALVGWIVLATSAFALDVTRCGQVVGRSDVGELVADLDCPAFPGSCAADPTVSCMSDADCPADPDTAGCSTRPPVVDGGVLRLNGHTLSSHDPDLARRWAVHVVRKGTILGPGTITAPDGTGVIFMGRRLVIADVELADSRIGINAALGGRVRATNVAAHDLQSSAITNARQLIGENLTVTRCGLDGTDLPPYEAHQVIYRSALAATRMTVKGLLATENGGAAVAGASVRIKGGSLGGNAAGLGDWDIATLRRPRLVETTCSHSGQVVIEEFLSIVGPWFVCTGD